MRLRVVAILVGVALFLFAGNLAAAPAVRLFVAEQEIIGDVPPTIVDGRTLVPVRVLAEAMGFSVKWDPAAQSVTLGKGARQIVLTIGRSDALVDGRPVALDMPATIVEGRTLIPVRFVAEQLGAEVRWDPATSDIHITPPTETARSEELAEVPGSSLASAGTQVRDLEGGLVTGTDPQILAWLKKALVREHVQAKGHLSLKMGLRDDSFTMTVNVDQTYYSSGPDMPQLTNAALMGSELVSGTAARRGKVWRLEPSSDTWKPATDTRFRAWTVDRRLNSPLDLTKLTDEELAMATVEVSEAELDGQPFQVVTLRWGLPMVAPLIGDQMGELQEGHMQLVYWIDPSGFTHRVDMSLVATDKATPGSRFDLTGSILFAPWNKPIPFPDEILRSEQALVPLHGNGIQCDRDVLKAGVRFNRRLVRLTSGEF